MKTEELRALLRQRYPSNEWALAFEVECGSRWADMFAMNLWPSRGYAIHGFELKVSRQDWLKELKSPEKAECAYMRCDYWWLVAAENVATIDEIPETWGFMEAQGNKLCVIKKAMTKPDAPLTRDFVASLFRRLSGYSDAELANAVNEKVKSMREGIEQEVQQRVERMTRRYSEQSKILDEIKKLTGLDLMSWQNSPPKIAQAVNLLLRCEVPDINARLRVVRTSLTKMCETLDQAIDQTKAWEK